jgi:electron transfer flavoprotein alpha subunit
VSGILIFVEHEGGKPKRIALEESSKASELTAQVGGQVIAVALGAGAADVAEPLGRYGTDIVYVDDNDVFDQYLADPHVDVLAEIVEREQPQVVLLPYTPDGKDIASRLGARLSSAMVANVVDVVDRDGRPAAKETVFGGNYITTVDVEHSQTDIFLVRANAFTPVENPKTPDVRSIEYSPSDAVLRVRKGKTVQEEGAPVPVDEASIIVSGGRGLGGPEPFSILQELADELGGVVGASRAAVDAGWISYPHQVGQTGRTVKPQLYVAVGISGAVQHRVGMQTADTVVAINKDPDAPIFALADLAVVGDLFQVVPALTEEIRKRKGA